MWSDILVAAEDVTSPAVAAEPSLPYQQIGLVLVALVTGITGIVVAMIQKGKSPSAAAVATTTPHNTAGSFVISEIEWITNRDRSIRVEAALEALRHEYNTHDQISSVHMQRMNGKIELIERRLGGPML